MKEMSAHCGAVILLDDWAPKVLPVCTWYLDDWGYPWHSMKCPDGKRRTRRLHVYILPPPDGMQVDHRDRNPLNNQLHNLRLATNQQNTFNRQSKRTPLRLRGVEDAPWCKLKPFRARIGINSKKVYIGNYATAEEAARAYDVKALELHGEFAVLNFPQPQEAA
jgi:hypothetical protein